MASSRKCFSTGRTVSGSANIFASELEFDKAIVVRRHEFAIEPPSYLSAYALPGPQNEA
jgi:hypothetical protein